MSEKRALTREEVNALPIRRYEGKVHVVSAPHEAMSDILQEAVVGFDTETRPAFRPGESYPPSLAQVSTARAVYLFPLGHREAAGAVAQMLEQAHIVKAGIGLGDDLKALRKLVEFGEKSIVDLGTAAIRAGYKQTGVRNLAGLFLGFRIPKGTKTSNWARSRLTPQQITYAATDAWVCRELYLLFKERGFL